MTKIGFIQVPKRYQTSPTDNDNKLQKEKTELISNEDNLKNNSIDKTTDKKKSKKDKKGKKKV